MPAVELFSASRYCSTIEWWLLAHVGLSSLLCNLPMSISFIIAFTIAQYTVQSNTCFVSYSRFLNLTFSGITRPYSCI